MSCLLMPRVMGCRRVPDPPARMMPFMVAQPRGTKRAARHPHRSGRGGPGLEVAASAPGLAGDREPAAGADDTERHPALGVGEGSGDAVDAGGGTAGYLGHLHAGAAVGEPGDVGLRGVLLLAGGHGEGALDGGERAPARAAVGGADEAPVGAGGDGAGRADPGEVDDVRRAAGAGVGTLGGDGEGRLVATWYARPAALDVARAGPGLRVVVGVELPRRAAGARADDEAAVGADGLDPAQRAGR